MCVRIDSPKGNNRRIGRRGRHRFSVLLETEQALAEGKNLGSLFERAEVSVRILDRAKFGKSPEHVVGSETGGRG